MGTRDSSITSITARDSSITPASQAPENKAPTMDGKERRSSLERTQRGPPKMQLSATQHKDVLELFALFDTDGGGTLDDDEIKIAMLTLGFLDVDDKGGLNHEQFITLVTEKVGQRNVRKELKQSFDLMTNGERYLKLQDFVDAAREPEVQMDDTDEELKQVWKFLDVGKDGFMNEERFLQLMTSDWEAHL